MSGTYKSIHQVSFQSNSFLKAISMLLNFNQDFKSKNDAFPLLFSSGTFKHELFCAQAQIKNNGPGLN